MTALFFLYNQLGAKQSDGQDSAIFVLKLDLEPWHSDDQVRGSSIQVKA
jgi:hypothetical protein